MRTLSAAAFALVLLALMPAFALLRYEHAALSTGPAGSPGDSGRASPPVGPSDRSVPLGPSIWTGFGAHANASSASIFERSLAVPALAGIADSLPRPAGAPPPDWGRAAGMTDSSGVVWPVSFAELLGPCAGVPAGGRCRDNARVTRVSFRLLDNDLENARMLAFWSVSPLSRSGYFYITLARQGGEWRATSILRSEGDAGGD